MKLARIQSLHVSRYALSATTLLIGYGLSPAAELTLPKTVMKHRVIIGNYLTNAPCGIAFVVDDKAAFVLDPGAPYYAGACAPDDSYHRLEFKKDESHVLFEWGRIGDCAVGRFSTYISIQIHLKLKQTWPDIPTSYEVNSDRATGLSADVGWALQTHPKPNVVNSTEIAIDASPRHAAYIVAGIGPLPSFDGIDKHLETARVAYEENRPSASGEWGDFIGAICDNLNNSRLYSTDNHLVAHSVCRDWSKDPNTAPYFCWDSFFNGNLASLEDPKTGRETVRAMLSYQTVEGLVPNFGHAGFDGGVSNDRSQPPVGAMCVWKMQERWPDESFLREVYPKLVTWHRWWAKARDGNHDGLLEWGSSTAQLHPAILETGWDDTVHFEGAEMVGNTLNADAVDLSSMWAMDAQYLSLIAHELGYESDATEFRNEHTAICERIRKQLWNPDLGIFCTKIWNGRFLTRLTPMNFYPLLAGAASPEQARQVIAALTDPKRFWGEWILPTVSYDDPVWPQQDYWRGKVWAPVNYLVFQGLQRYAAPELMNEFADKSLRLFMRNWTAKRVCGENFLSKDGTQSSTPYYTWGALLCLIGLENIIRLEPDGKLRLNGTLQAHAELRNVPLAGRTYRVVVSPSKTELITEHSGRTVATAIGTVLIGDLPQK